MNIKALAYLSKHISSSCKLVLLESPNHASIPPRPRCRIHFHFTNIYRRPTVYQGLGWVVVATVMDKPDSVSWSLISGAMSLCLYLT